ncbi:MAG: Mor transcription activator family protein [Chromatiaceae bacterium]
MALSPPKAEMIVELLNLARDAIVKELAGQVTAGQAEALAERMVTGFLTTWGGCALYLPKPEALFRLQRNREIARSFVGGDADAIRLARRFGITTSSVYRLAREHAHPQRQEISP